ncbi:MAG: DUF4277 domain-containing protein, partial [Desulfobacterales bacterium]
STRQPKYEGVMQQLIPDNLTYTDVGDLPIIKHFAKQINLVDTINTMVKSQMQLQPGQAVQAMVLDTLSGRTPLYRLKEFFHEKDTELLLGTEIDTELFCDHNLGRVLDKIFDTGAQAIFSQLSPNAVKRFGIDTRDVHFDTTSISVYGDYELTDEPFKIAALAGGPVTGQDSTFENSGTAGVLLAGEIGIGAHRAFRGGDRRITGASFVRPTRQEVQYLYNKKKHFDLQRYCQN